MIKNNYNKENTKREWAARAANIVSIMSIAVPTNDFQMKGQEVIIHDNENGKLIHIGVENFFMELRALVDYMMNYYAKGKSVYECGSLIICLEKILRYTESDSEYYKIFREETLEKWNAYKNKNKENDTDNNFVASICGVIDQRKLSKEEENELTQYTPSQKAGKLIFSFDVTDKLNVFKHFLTNEEFEEGKEKYIEYIIKNEDLLKSMIRNGYITKEDVTTTIDQDDLYCLARKGNSTYLNKFLDAEHLLKGYREGFIDKKELYRLDLDDLLINGIGSLNKEELIDVLIEAKRENKKDNKKTKVYEIIWELFEKDYFSNDDLNKLAYYRFVDIDYLIEKYTEERARKIRAEFYNYSVSDEKLVQILTPNKVFKIIERADSKRLSTDFVKNDLQGLYEKNGLDWKSSLISEVESRAEKSENKSPDYMFLYENGLLPLSDLAGDKVTESDVEELYKTSCNGKVLADAYSCGLLEAVDVFSILNEDTNKLCALIKEAGLNACVLPEFYSPYEILKMYNENKISAENLVSLKDGMDIEEIKKLYVTKKLALDMLDDLVSINFISPEQSEEIQSAYDIKADYEKLLEKGRVLGFLGEEEATPKAETKATRVHRGERKIIKDKIGKNLRRSLFKLLGAEDKVLPVEGNIWERGEGNELYTILDKKVAFIEPKNGRELTFAMPLRLILEYATGGDEIISKAKKKKDLMSSPFIKSYKHSAQWGLKTIEAVSEFNEEFAKTKPTKKPEYKAVIKDISDSYKQATEQEKIVK